ncbi:MAG: MFS transporter [Candidatus Eremiobacteraeota bacterium]|nr:MFS transporter [Candidatus Eremiobacteraeota bacterium]
MNSNTRAIAGKPNAPLLAAYWFGIQLVWGAVLGISLQARCAALSGNSALATFGEISTLGAFAAAVVQLAVGPWSDALRRQGNNRSSFYIAGAVAGAVAVVAFYVAPGIPALTASFVALQVALNVAIGPYQAILPDTIGKAALGKASAWMAAMQSGGNAGGAILATLLGNHLPLGATIAVALLATCTLTVAHLRSVSLQTMPDRKKLVVSRTLVDLFISRALMYVGFYTLLGYFFFYVRGALPAHAPIDATTASGIGILLFTLAGAAGAVVAGKPSDRIDERIIVTAGGTVIALAVIGLVVNSAWIFTFAAISVAGIGWGIFLCADWAFACRLLPPSALATTMGIWNVAVVGPQMLAPLFTTIVLSSTHVLDSPAGPHVAFGLAAFEMLLSVAWIWRLPGSKYGKELRGS